MTDKIEKDVIEDVEQEAKETQEELKEEQRAEIDRLSAEADAIKAEDKTARQEAKEELHRQKHEQKEEYQEKKRELKEERREAKEELKHTDRAAYHEAKEEYKEARHELHEEKKEQHEARKQARRDYKQVHKKYHKAYKNAHWEMLSQSKNDKELRKKIKQESKEYRKNNGMLKYPLMSDIFDFAEEDRALPNSMTPWSDEIRIVKDVVYKTIDGEDLVLDLYFPKNQMHNAPVVMDIPGGGWMIHNRPRRDGYARLYAKLGAVVAVIDHRLCPAVFFPDNLHDCIDAYNFLVDHAEEYDINPNDITVTGDSSGGHLSACVGCAATSKEYVEKLGLPELKTKPANLIFISGAFSFEVMYRIPMTHTLIVRYFSGKKSRKEYRNWEFYKESIPYNYLNKDYPESYNNGGATDILCFGEAKRFAKELTKAGVKNEFKVGKDPINSSHCYVLRLPFPAARQDMLRIMKWYVDRRADRGVDLTVGYKAVEEFLTNYGKKVKEIE